MSETTQAPFTLRDGLNLALYDWPLPMRWRPRAVLLIVHGLGEHAWRYDPVAHRLNEWGFCVRSYDQRGHGESGGARGVLPDDDALLDDLAEVVDDTRSHIAEPWSCPLILMGHSMGGLVAATFVQRGMGRVDGLVLSSPALDAGIGWLQRQFIRLLYRHAPDFALSNGLDADKISHNPATVQAYRPEEKDRAQAAINFCVFATMALTSFASGALVTTQGWHWLNMGSLVPVGLTGVALLWLALSHRKARQAA